jgi:GNAT superfamily N-acetyltransferase
VRPASKSDADELGRIQVATWRIGYAKVLPEQILQSLDEVVLAAGWLAAITAPPSLRHHVLVAAEGDVLVGFAAFGPDADAQPEDPDIDATVAIPVLLVEPRWGRRGHGSRLLAAIVDTARGDGVRRMVAWVPVSNTPTLEFYRSAGWESDGVQRTLDTGAGTVNELRLHASIDA